MHLLTWLANNWIALFWVMAIFGIMIFIHEFGHFIVAKRMGVKVLEFALGFGKKIIAFQKGDTEYSLRLFPLGGYVKMVGEGEAGDPNDPGNFQNKSAGARIAIIAAGPIMNCVLAFLLLVFLGLFFGKIQASFTNEVHQIIAEKPAAKAGLTKGDKLIAINGEQISSGERAMELIRANTDKILNLTVKRQGKEQIFTVIPMKNPETGLGMIGVLFKPTPSFVSPGIAAALENVHFTFATVGLMPVKVFQLLAAGEMSWKDVREGSGGPIGIAQFIFESAPSGFGHMLWVAGLLNVAIGFFNLYPIPALDGARIAFLSLSLILPKPLNPEKEELIHFVGFILLIFLVLIVSYQDVVRLIQGKKFF